MPLFQSSRGRQAALMSANTASLGHRRIAYISPYHGNILVEAACGLVLRTI